MKKRGYSVKKTIVLCAFLLTVALIFIGCAGIDGDSGLDGAPRGYDPLPAGQGTSADNALVQGLEEELAWDRIPMVMVNGKLYCDTGKESTLYRRCGTPDGEIISTVDGS